MIKININQLDAFVRLQGRIAESDNQQKEEVELNKIDQRYYVKILYKMMNQNSFTVVSSDCQVVNAITLGPNYTLGSI